MNSILKINKNTNDKLPIEIIEKIINYRLSYIHTLNFKNITNLIPLQSVLFKIIYIDKIYKIERNFTDDFLDIILELTSYDERFDMMKILNTCKCCKEHQIRRPTLRQFLEGYVTSYSTNFQKIKKCKCKCRQFCRNLCRAQNDEIDQSL
jgi:hypothetical protein